MEKRTLEAILMLQGLRSRILLVRQEFDADYQPIVTSRLWKAEQALRSAETMIHGGQGRNEA